MDCTSLEFDFEKKKTHNEDIHTLTMPSKHPIQVFIFPAWYLNFSSAFKYLLSIKANPLSFKLRETIFVLHAKRLSVIHSNLTWKGLEVFQMQASAKYLVPPTLEDSVLKSNLYDLRHKQWAHLREEILFKNTKEIPNFYKRTSWYFSKDTLAGRLLY